MWKWGKLNVAKMRSWAPRALSCSSTAPIHPNEPCLFIYLKHLCPAHYSQRASQSGRQKSVLRGSQPFSSQTEKTSCHMKKGERGGRRKYPKQKFLKSQPMSVTDSVHCNQLHFRSSTVWLPLKPTLCFSLSALAKTDIINSDAFQRKGNVTNSAEKSVTFYVTFAG